MRAAWILLAVAACSKKTPEAKACEDLCDELVVGCAYEAYPSIDSCMQGCLYELSLGADPIGQLPCILEADCDEFAVVECEHEYGADG
jgi:hypothetical protein